MLPTICCGGASSNLYFLAQIFKVAIIKAECSFDFNPNDFASLNK